MKKVSIIIPCYNEEKYIARCLDSIVANDYPKDFLEIIVVDGMSNDGTRAVLSQYSERYPFIRIIDNPERIKPRALNMGIRAAKGDIIIRMDAHASYDPLYILKSVQYLEKCKVDNIGGTMKTLPREPSLIGKCIAFAMSSRFGVGNSYFRVGSNRVREVETVFGGCYRKDVFDRIGLFDETLVRGQDREFNMRLKDAGGKIILAPDIKCTYYARSNFASHIKHGFVSGSVPFLLTKFTGKCRFSWRNLVPLTFVLVLITSLFLSFLSSTFLEIFMAVVALYLAAAFVASIPVARRERGIRFLFIMPLVFATTHIAYGLGSLVGLFKPVKRGIIWSEV